MQPCSLWGRGAGRGLCGLGVWLRGGPCVAGAGPLPEGSSPTGARRRSQNRPLEPAPARVWREPSPWEWASPGPFLPCRQF